MALSLLIDDELDSLLRLEAEKTGRSVNEVAAAVLRGALVKPKAEAEAEFRIQPHHGAFGPGVDPQNLNRIADLLEDEAFAALQSKSL